MMQQWHHCALKPIIFNCLCCATMGSSWLQWVAGDSDDHNHVTFFYILVKLLVTAQSCLFSSPMLQMTMVLFCHRLVIVVTKKGS